jgi:hypothetical protein
MKRWYDELRRGDHAAHIYHTEGEQVKVTIDLLAWMGEDLKLVIMSNREAGERPAPRSRILDAAMEDGQLDILPARSSLSSSGKFRAETLMDIIYLELGKALDEGRSGLVFVWDLDWLSQEPENFEAHIVQQSKLSLTALPRELTLLGQYGVANFSPQQVERVIQVNQLVLEDGQLNRNFWVVSTTSMGGPPRDNRQPPRSSVERSTAKGS